MQERKIPVEVLRVAFAVVGVAMMYFGVFCASYKRDKDFSPLSQFYRQELAQRKAMFLAGLLFLVWSLIPAVW